MVCGHKKHQNKYDQFRISESERAHKFLDATVHFHDKVFVRICDWQDIHAVLGADIYYHSNCFEQIFEQTMPSWSGFNSIVTTENVPEKKVGFLPLIPQPVTQCATVYTALKNFQNVLSQLEQAHIALTCDEGVYHIAREITLRHKDELQDMVLCLGSFHMIKVLLGCLGKFIEGSGAESIFVENSVFGINVVQSVLSGSNYVRSVEGMMLLCEVMERIRYCAFFKEYPSVKYEE